MGWQPISQYLPQFVDGNGDPFSGAVLKAYTAGTSTNINMATDSTGGTTATSIALNANGYPEVSGTQVIPHIEEAYKLSLYPTQAAADSDTGATWTIDNLSTALSFGEKTVSITTNTTLTSAAHANAQLNVTGTTTLTLPAIASVSNAFIATIRNAGTGVVTLDGNAAETINGSATVTIPPSGSAILIAGDTTWSANIALAAPTTHGTNGQLLQLSSGVPAWATISNGQWDYVATHTASADSNLDVTDIDGPRLFFIQDWIPGTDNTHVWLLTSTDNGSTFDTGASDYGHGWHGLRIDASIAIEAAGDNADTEIQLSASSQGVGSTAGETFQSTVVLHAPQTTQETIVSFTSTYVGASAELFTLTGGGHRNSSADVDAVQFKSSSGTFSATIYEYKLVTS